MNSQEFESYVPVYDTVPEKWEEARQFLVEHLKRCPTQLMLEKLVYV